MEGDNYHLVFAVNRERFDLQSVDPSTSLLEFLRTGTRFKSVKLGCGEGGCGACVVVLSKYDHHTDRVENYTVCSCLTLLCSINGCSITTSEGLGNSRDGFHAIHQRLAGFHATQCGFCTPGICVSLFSALCEADSKTSPPESSPGFSNLSASEAEKSVLGNLCRCTGYRPIADVCKSFSHDMDIEDLGLNSFWKKGDSKEMMKSELPMYNSSNQNFIFPQFLKIESKSPLVMNTKAGLWCTPRSIRELQDLLESNECDTMSKVKLVVGNTGVGYYKELEKYDKYIDLRFIPELSVIEMDHTGVRLGAASSISKVIEVLHEGNNSLFNTATASVYWKIANHFEKVASKFIRNLGSIGGNLVMAQRNNFPSDIVTVLLAAGAMVDLVRYSKRETISLADFLEGPTLESKSFLVSVTIPSWMPIHIGTTSALIFETYRASSRPLGNSLPYLNAAICAEVSLSGNCNAIVINNIKLVFGAFGCKHAICSRNVEEFLIGKPLDNNLLYEAVKLIQSSVVPGDGVTHALYRSSLTSSFLFQFLHPLLEACTETYTIALNGCIDVLSAVLSRVTEKYSQLKMNIQHPLLLPAKQAVGPVGEFPPVGEPVVKSGAALQASGEAVYVDDIPCPPNCLHGAFIYSTKPLARIKELKFKTKSLPEGVSTIISFKDIPKGGENIGCKTIFAGEPLFADDLTVCAGQPIALVVANTQKQADIASNLAVVEYDLENIDPPILTVEEAEERSSFFEVYPFIRPKPVGDFSKGMDEADHMIVSAEIRLPSQYYFYMETQSSIAIPEEDNCMVVYSSSQCPEMSHRVIAKCLGVPENNVRVITKRVGGGFGGKAIRAMPTTTACALASHSLRRPVKIYLNRKTDMIMAGGRHPMKVTYTVGYKSNGKVTALYVKILINAGKAEDISPIIPLNVVNALKKYNWGALSLDIKVCKTNHTSKSAMRGPGEVQGSFIAEAVIEHVASSLSMDVDSVRETNLHSFESLCVFYEDTGGEPHEYTLPLIWDKLAIFSAFDQRVELVREFNESHIWRKRGISRVPVIHGVLLRPTPGKVSILGDGSVVVEVGGIEIGQGLWTKVKQMTAFALSSIQCDGTGSLLDKVRVIQADTLSQVQGGFTSGSTTSESSCEAVRICCDVLVERLHLLKEKLQKEMDSVNWEMLIAQAHMQSVNLSASSYYVPELTSMHYLNYGAAVSEVEVNVLTGETSILRSDIVYDCGKSLNPAVDLGQIEGAFVQGIGFFMTEEYLSNQDGLVIADSTWSYKIPTIDTIPKQLNVEVLNSGHHQKRVLSSKASGEPPLLLAASVHCATRAAIKEARKQISSWRGISDNNNGHEDDSVFQLSVPATMPVVKELCGLDVVEKYLSYKLAAAGIKQ